MRCETRRAGFTLLEVLAAVAVLGIVFISLATAAMYGLRAQGESQRRLTAALLADETLAEIEEQLRLNGVLTEEESEVEEDDYLVRVSIEPMQPEDGGMAPELESLLRARPELEDSLLAVDLSSIKRIFVEVSWFEGEDEIFVARRSYGADQSGLNPLQGLPGGASPANSNAPPALQLPGGARP